jgi:glycosyltransferase involved in cell wall biosynthesis
MLSKRIFSSYPYSVRGITVAVPTFNSEKWIEPLIMSIHTSGLGSNVKTEILIFDDSSTDTTIKILTKIKEKFKLDIKIINIPEHEKKSSTYSYKFIIEKIKPKFALVALCDHDDIWLPNKIFQIIDYFELTSQKNQPWLYCGTSLNWPPQGGRMKFRSSPGPRGKSHLKNAKLDHRKTAFEVAVSTHNMAFNNELIKELRFCPLTENGIKNGVEFDNWLPFIASKVGISVFDVTPTLLWRQHYANSSGDFSERKTRKWLLNRIIRNFFLVKNGNFAKYLSVFITAQNLPEEKSHTIWALKNFEKINKRIKLAFNNDWKHWNYFMDKYLRIRIILLREKSISRIAKGL